jgi:peptidoglycan endopeptidase LytE
MIVSLPIIAITSVTNISALGWLRSTSMSTVTLYDQPALKADTYDYGYCTYWVAMLRIQAGDPIPNNWGDAINWAIRARLAGYYVNQTPTVGSIMQDSKAPGGEGHVAYVEHVDQTTGAWTVSEMNAVGWDEVDQRTFSASAAEKYQFIHDVSLNEQQVLN